MQKVQVIASGEGHYSRTGSLELVRATNGQLFISFDTSNGEYGPLGITLDDLEDIVYTLKLL